MLPASEGRRLRAARVRLSRSARRLVRAGQRSLRRGSGGHHRTRRPRRGRLHRILRCWRWVLASLLALVVLAVAAVVVAYVRTPVPTEPQDGATDEGSTVYYADGRTPLLRLGANRQSVRHGQIPDRLRWAVLAAEDRGFYRNQGVSVSGTARALLKDASGGDVQGGSTITQQLARNYFKGLSRDRTAGRKIKEILVALKLDRHRAKDEILDLYLNTVYFGRQTSGVEAAARAYFDKDVWQLDVAECALLAAMIQRPGYFRTRGGGDAAKALRARWGYVLDGMVSMGKLDRAGADRLRFPRTREEWRGVSLSGQDLLARQRVLDELESAGVPADAVVNGRLRIYTGLDRRWMASAEQAMRKAREPEWPKDVRTGLVAVDPASGAVKAFYAGDPRRGRYDSVFEPVAQAASTFKPYVLAAALRRGYSVRTKVPGKSPLRFAPDGSVTPMTAPGYKVSNDAEIGSLGTVDLVKATALSVNTGFVKAALKTGVANVAETARRFGVPESALRPYKGQAGLALGIANVSAAVQAGGYAAFANGGTAVTPHLVTKVVDAHGRRVPLPWDRPGRRVLTAEQAAQATYAMRAVVTGGTGRRAALPDRDAAGKTGTSDDNHAAWFVGYVPQLSASVMMTRASASPLKGLPGHPGKVAGENVPSQIWQAFMADVTRNLPTEPFPEPAFTGNAVNWDDTVKKKDPGGPGSHPKTRNGTPAAGAPPVPTRVPREDGTPGPPADARSRKKWCATPGNDDAAVCAAP
ncbi:transglycosylase domain-containing protein [Actinomadura opuntiae]|uniref:transglycosylase domain-containing protein n=1 Tax=Actinomadura sp. OS1-43 TaxID=604315 RepID=UPI00255ADC8D|nr:transglycosylase domain-containing protein [Actinomadura sp. OS1-43]MDL4814615.1 transglycosylase domain-containing protein [Actinomadura sp. OS1-43]